MKSTKSTSKKSNRISIANSTELHRIKKTINTSAEAVESLVKSVKDKSRQALAEALICGKALLRAKEIIGHGGFMRWIRENCKTVSHDTASRYMKVANSALVRNQLTTGVGLRQAYIAIGILKEDDETSASNGVSSLSASQRTIAPSKTPLADSLALGNGRQPVVVPKPVISKEDATSRIRYLVNELAIDIFNKLQAGIITSSDVRKELKPLEELMR